MRIFRFIPWLFKLPAAKLRARYVSLQVFASWSPSVLIRKWICNIWARQNNKFDDRYAINAPFKTISTREPSKFIRTFDQSHQRLGFHFSQIISQFENTNCRDERYQFLALIPNCCKSLWPNSKNYFKVVVQKIWRICKCHFGKAAKDKGSGDWVSCWQVDTQFIWMWKVTCIRIHIFWKFS